MPTVPTTIPNDHQLLMEALMLFSSEESDSSSGFSEDSDVVTKTDASRSVQLASHNSLNREHDDDSFLERAVEDVLHRMPMSQHDQDGSTIHRKLGKRSFDDLLRLPIHSTPRYGRKRSKKCTYAARRQEVSRLRLVSTELETQLEHASKYFQQGRHGHHDALHRLQFEREQLAISQAENVRLRAMVEAGEVRVRQLQAVIHSESPPPQ